MEVIAGTVSTVRGQGRLYVAQYKDVVAAWIGPSMPMAALGGQVAMPSALFEKPLLAHCSLEACELLTPCRPSSLPTQKPAQ